MLLTTSSGIEVVGTASSKVKVKKSSFTCEHINTNRFGHFLFKKQVEYPMIPIFVTTQFALLKDCETFENNIHSSWRTVGINTSMQQLLTQNTEMFRCLKIQGREC